MNTSKRLETALSGFKGLKGQDRKDHTETAKSIFLEYLKENNHIYFKRDLLNSFLPSGTDARTQSRIVSPIIQLLENEKIIEIGQLKEQDNPTFRNREVFCVENSYSVMMRKNGYTHTRYFNWEYDQETRTPKKVFIAKLRIGENPTFDFDGSELIETKPRTSQKVLTNSQKSLTKVSRANHKRIYFVLPHTEKRDISQFAKTGKPTA